MQSDKHERLKALLSEVLDSPPEQRGALVAETCSTDTELGAELNRLLAAEGTGSDPLAIDDSQPQDSLNPPEWPTRVGPWEILSELGRGGMGAVFLARRADASFNTTVAVKLIHAAAVGSVHEQQFRREWRIHASLEHPNVARVLDAGRVDDFLYLVVEYVDGVSLDRYCREAQLSVRELVRLVRKVCDGLAYAHTRLVVHRDVKPSNILMNSTGEPKLIDFGIAGHEFRPLSTYTLCHRRLTPRYASPEQLAGDEWVTTQSDVYSLGVVLYELLTGAWPYDVNPQLPGHEVWAAVLGERAVPPSARSSGIDRDLDAVVMKTLRLEPAERYASVEAFGADLDRYLAGVPVMARKSSFWHRTRKFVTRNRRSVAIGALSAVCIVTLALSNYRQARIAERRYEDIQSLANSVLSRVTERVWAIPGSLSTVRYITETRVQYIDNLLRDSPQDFDLRRNLVRALLSAGTVQGYPAAENCGDFEAANRSFVRALDNARQLAARTNDPRDLINLSHALNYNGVMRSAAGDLQSAAALYAEAIDINAASEESLAGPAAILALSCSRLGMVRASEGKASESLDLHARALRIRRHVLSASPVFKERRGLSLTLNYYGQSLAELGRHAEAEQAFREMLELEQVQLKEQLNSVETGVYAANARFRLGLARHMQRQPEGTRAAEEALVELKKLREAEPDGVRIRNLLALVEQTLHAMRSGTAAAEIPKL